LCFQGTSADFSPSTTFVADGEWHQVKVTWDMATLVIYVDGVAKASTSTLSNGARALSTAGNVNFLGRGNSETYYFTGQLKEIHFYDVVI